jgi:trehalose 6-phosphate phosphatase
MRHILGRIGREALAGLASRRALLAFDYDGTLAPIVRQRGRARMRARTRRLFERLARLYPCVVISGRARADVRRRLRGTGVRGVVGNHGIEPSRATRRVSAQVRRWRPVLARRLAAAGGVEIEDKRYSLAVHYRGSRDKRSARAKVLDAVAPLLEARVVGGKHVVNVLPSDAPHKGQALERERRRLRCAKALYVGDDETDEDAFALGRAGRLLAIRVGRRRGSAAAFYLSDQREVDLLLEALLELSENGGGHEDPDRGRARRAAGGRRSG